MASDKTIHKRRTSVAFIASQGKTAEAIAGELGVPLRTVKRDLAALHSAAADYQKTSQHVLFVLMGQLNDAAERSHGRTCAEIANAMRRWFPADASGSSNQPIVYEILRPYHDDDNGK